MGRELVQDGGVSTGDRRDPVLPAIKPPIKVCDLPPPLELQTEKITIPPKTPDKAVIQPNDPDPPYSDRALHRKANRIIEGELSADKKDLREMIGALKANGHGDMIQIVRGVAVHDRDSITAMKLFRELGPADAFSVRESSTPAAYLRQYGSARAVTSRDLLPRGEKKIDLVPFGLLITPLSDSDPDKIRVQVIDYLAPGKASVLDKRINLEDPDQRKEISDQMLKVFRKRLHGGVYASAIESAVPSKDYEPVLTAHHSRLNPAGGLNTLSQNFKTAAFVVLPNGAAREKSFQEVAVPMSKVESGIAINGEIQAIEMHRDVTLKAGGFTLDSAGRVTSVGGQPVATAYFDKNGNYITRGFSYSRNPEPGDTVRESIEIKPPYNFSVRGEKNSRVSVDLSPLGYDKETKLAVSRTLDRITMDGGIPIYTDTDPKNLVRNYKKQIARLADGVSEAEKLFNLVPGTDIQQIAVLNSDRPNASFSKLNPATITILDERLAEKGAKEVARHESFHLVDGKFDYKLSAGLEPLQQRLLQSSPAFFRKLNESSFIPEIGTGGHSNENSREFFASLMNSVVNERCEERLKKMDPEFRKNYAEALETIRGQFAATPGFPQSAPIIALIDRRLSSAPLQGASVIRSTN